MPRSDDRGLVDPTDGTALSAHEGLLRSEGGGVYPVLAGVPVLVPDPAGWMAAHRDAVLASLAEVGAADADALRIVDAFASQARVDPAPFGDDWTGDEEAWDEPPPGASAAFRAFLDEARGAHVHDVLAGLAGEGALEVGCGAGPLTRRLRSPIAMDRSLRAVLRAGGGVVADAEALPFADGAFDAIVAANVVDLLDAPGAFVDEAFRVARPGGRLVLSTPDPALGVVDGPDDALDELLEGAGWTVREARDGVPWIRSHGARHHQVYFVRIVVAEKPRGRARRRN